MSKIFKTFLILCECTILLTSCSKAKEQNKSVINLVMAEVNPENSHCGQMDKFFKDKVEELSNGTIIIDLRFSGVCGDEKQVINFMMQGNSTIQLARVTANLSPYGEKKSELLTIPYTFKSPEHFWKFASSNLAQDMLEQAYNDGLGVRGLCYAEEGFRNFFSTNKISSVNDIKGKKMRVAGKNLENLAKSLEAEPVKCEYTDLYMSLQTGMVEVAEQPFSNYLSNSFYKVAPYLILDKHMLGVVQIMVTSECWDTLSAEQQSILKEAAMAAAQFCKDISEQQEIDAALKLVSEGVTIVSVPDMEPWKKACQGMIEENSKEYSEIYKQIVNLGE